MKILVIGSTGTIGAAIYNNLKTDYDYVYGAHRNSKSCPVDITKKESIQALLDKLPQLDIIINTAGIAVWKPFSNLTEEDYLVGIQSKLMGQVNLVHVAQKYVNDNASILLTTGILGEHYEPNTVGSSLINGAIHSFVNSASNELPRGIRLNAVAPGAIAGAFPEDKKFAGYFPVKIEDVVGVYRQILNNSGTGGVYKIY